MPTIFSSFRSVKVIAQYRLTSGRMTIPCRAYACTSTVSIASISYYFVKPASTNYDLPYSPLYRRCQAPRPHATANKEYVQNMNTYFDCHSLWHFCDHSANLCVMFTAEVTKSESASNEYALWVCLRSRHVGDNRAHVHYTLCDIPRVNS